MQDLVLGLMDNWNGVWFALKEDGKNADVG